LDGDASGSVYSSSNDSFWNIPSGLTTPTRKSAATERRIEIETAMDFLQPTPSPVQLQQPKMHRTNSRSSIHSTVSSQSDASDLAGNDVCSETEENDAIIIDGYATRNPVEHGKENKEPWWKNKASARRDAVKLLSQSPEPVLSSPFTFSIPKTDSTTQEWLQGTPTAPPRFVAPPSLDLGQPTFNLDRRSSKDSNQSHTSSSSSKTAESPLDGEIAEIEADLDALNTRLVELRNSARERYVAKLPEEADLSHALSTDIWVEVFRFLGASSRRHAAGACKAFAGVALFGTKLDLFDLSVGQLASAGANHSIMCTAEGSILTFGTGDNGRLGHGSLISEESPRVVDFLTGIIVVQVSAGDSHTALCTEDGELYTFGCGEDGRLGHGVGEDEWLPRKVQAMVGKHVVSVSAGNNHTLVCTKEGEVYSFGSGKYGRLGHNNRDGLLTPMRVEGLLGKKAVCVAAGDGHSAVCTSEGQCFTFGRGLFGELGHGDLDNEFVPRLVASENIQGKKIVAVTAGHWHTAMCTEEGSVYTFGRGENGRLGHGTAQDESSPRLVEGLAGRKVKEISAGYDYTIVCTQMGEVLTFGFGCGWSLGADSIDTRLSPSVVEGLAKTKVVGVAAGNCHAVVCTAEGRVIRFGHGLVAQLKDNTDPESPLKSPIPMKLSSNDWDADDADGHFDLRGNFDMVGINERLRAMEEISVF